MATSPHSIHHAAAAGYQANADRYVLGRPDYPAEIAAPTGGRGRGAAGEGNAHDALPDLRVLYDQGLSMPLTLTLSHRERGRSVPPVIFSANLTPGE
ncbi:hypothetical protein FHU10_1905 [Serratia fonticola]|uniref:Uncharacterized protein n=1 Tax=Serratia fonticola TaxID=47917 RepID=A0A542CVQ4_SERFO|nr:hypothetical protein FHU09_0545 [Serratia fonticola]TQI94900.1 hypothetical protein FHU11_0247 [Serratia fonticola]TVZ69397.1 hypothetical protein FHU10_1905 [Serratia fonticola]